MIEFAAARQRAVDHLHDRFPELRGSLGIAEEMTRKEPDGWVFQWNSVDYLRTRDDSALLLGAVPVWVSASGAEVDLRLP